VTTTRPSTPATRAMWCPTPPRPPHRRRDARGQPGVPVQPRRPVERGTAVHVLIRPFGDPAPTLYAVLKIRR
jgi:hypothetical protein